MKLNTHTSDIGLGIHSVLQRADQEIEKLKKASINPISWRVPRKISRTYLADVIRHKPTT